MRIGIIGTGAVGGYYGALLAKNGYDVHFLLNTDYEHVAERGLRVESKGGDFLLDRVNVYSNAKEMPPCDMVIVALKTTQNDILHDILPYVTATNATVVVLQNGYGNEADLQKIVPDKTVIGGLCFLCCHKVGPGHIRHFDYGSIRLGMYQPGGGPAINTDVLKHASHIFSNASIPIQLTDNLDQARWEKLVWNMGFNGISVILGATTHQIINHRNAFRLVKSVMNEVVCGARACGFDLSDRYADTMLAATRKMIDYSPSMKFDYENGRKMEVEFVYWRPIREAEKNGYVMTRSKFLAFQLDYLDSVNL